MTGIQLQTVIEMVFLHHSVQTGSGYNPTSYPMDTRIFPWE